MITRNTSITYIILSMHTATCEYTPADSLIHTSSYLTGDITLELKEHKDIHSHCSTTQQAFTVVFYE